jgi:hypothetical protein
VWSEAVFYRRKEFLMTLPLACSGFVQVVFFILGREEMMAMKHWQQIHSEAEEKITAYHRDLAESSRAEKAFKQYISSAWKSLRHMFVQNYQQKGGRDETTFYQAVGSKK